METLVFNSCTKLPCIGTSNAPIILCIDDDVSLVSGGHTLPAVLNTGQESADDCSCEGYWVYNVSYDEALLTTPEVLLVSADITAVWCLDCFTDWIQELIANAIAAIP